MSLLDELKTKINEAGYKLVNKTVIRDGKKQLIKQKEYKTPCKDGYKHDSKTGRCVKMTSKEQRNRSMAAKKAANNPATKRKKSQSMKRRSSLIKKG